MAEHVFSTSQVVRTARQIFHPRHIGGAYVEGSVEHEFLQRLKAEIRGLEECGLIQAPCLQHDPTKPSQLSLGAKDLSTRTSPITLPELPFTMRLAQAYTDEVHNPIASLIGLEQIGLVNSILILKYAANLGIKAYHKDADEFVDLSGILTVEGNGVFKIAPTQKGRRGSKSPNTDEEVSHALSPGGLVLIRGNTQDRHGEHPFHEFRALDEDRIAVVFGVMR